MKYAVVRNKHVDNIIEAGGNGAIALESVMNCTLVPCEQYRVQVGDSYENGLFMRDGVPVERIKTTDEKINSLQRAAQMTFQMQLYADRAAEANAISDNQILATVDVFDYPEWEDNHEYKTKGEIVKHNGMYFEVIAPHTSNGTSYPVETTFAYYRHIELTHTGTIADPIPYPETQGVLVDVKNGLYYTYKGHLYFAKSDMPNCVYPPDTVGMWQWEKVEVLE